MLDEIKNYLNITYDDIDMDKKLGAVISRAEHILNGYASSEIDFETDLSSKQLLFDLCRYIWNDAYEDFKTNYVSELIMLRANYEVIGDEETEISAV